MVVAGLVPCFGVEEKSALDASFQGTVDLLKTRSFEEKAEAARAIAVHTHPRTLEVLTALLDAELYTERKTDRVVFATGLEGGGFHIRDAVTGEELGQVGRHFCQSFAQVSCCQTKAGNLDRENDSDLDVTLIKIDSIPVSAIS